MATLLTKYKVVSAAKDEVSEDVAREEMQKLMAGSTARMVVNLPEPEKLWIKLVRRRERTYIKVEDDRTL